MKISILTLTLLMNVFIFNILMAQAVSAKPDSEIVREFKAVLKSNEFLDFREKAEALKPIKAETLKTHRVYKDLLDVVKNEDLNGLVRKISIELLLYFKAESHEILGLEGDFISLLQADTTGWFIRKTLMNTLPDLISPDDSVNINRLKDALVAVLNTKEKVSEPNPHLNELKRSALGVMAQVGVPYSKIKTIVEAELKASKSDLRVAILQYLADYSSSNKNFNDSDIKNFCRNLFKSANEYTPTEISLAITLYSNLITNEDKFRLQGSDEEIFFKFLKSDEDIVIMASAKALYKVKSLNAVDKLVERLQEVMTKSEPARNALIDSLIYLETSLLYAKAEMSPSLKRASLITIRDKFIILLTNPAVKGTLQKKLFDAFDLFGIEHDAYEYIDLETLKKLVNLLANLKEDEAKVRVGEILGNFTGQNFKVDATLWARWVSIEEKSPTRKFK